MEEIDWILAHRGASEMTSEVQWLDRDMVQFMAANGFKMAPRVMLSRSTDPIIGEQE